MPWTMDSLEKQEIPSHQSRSLYRIGGSVKNVHPFFVQILY
jgi:hypothetical protein